MEIDNTVPTQSDETLIDIEVVDPIYIEFSLSLREQLLSHCIKDVANYEEITIKLSSDQPFPDEETVKILSTRYVNGKNPISFYILSHMYSMNDDAQKIGYLESNRKRKMLVDDNALNKKAKKASVWKAKFVKAVHIDPYRDERGRLYFNYEITVETEPLLSMFEIS
jgi:hypothetical protein